MLEFGYNQAEAHRAFQLAAEADPTAAMPQWGMAFAKGPYPNKWVCPAELPGADCGHQGWRKRCMLAHLSIPIDAGLPGSKLCRPGCMACKIVCTAAGRPLCTSCR